MRPRPGWVLRAVREAAGGFARRHAAVADTLAVVAALATLNVVKNLVPGGGIWVGVTAAFTLIAFARHRGLSWRHLGLTPAQLRSGAAWALGAVAAVAAVYLTGVLIPATRPAFLDSRYDFGPAQALSAAFVVIPLSTVLLEEVAFRSVLWGMLSRHARPRTVLAVSSALFGLWHVLPSLDFADSQEALKQALPPGSPAATALVVVGTVVFTAAGGVVAGELRRRSGSPLASAGMHWATNGLGVLFGVVARRLLMG